MNLRFKLDKKTHDKESEFTSDFLKQFRQEWWGYKISDLVRTIKPFDWFGVNKWGVYFCEVKMIDSNIFKFSKLRDNQYTALKRIQILKEKYELDSLHSVVMVYSKKFKNYQVIPFNRVLAKEKKWEDEIKLLF